MKDKQLESYKEVYTGIFKHRVKVTEMQWNLHSEIDVFSEYYTGCPICAIS